MALWRSAGKSPERPTETKDAVSRRHSAGPHYQPVGVPYMPPLGELDIDRAVDEAWGRVIWVYRAIDARAKNASRLTVRVNTGRGLGATEIENHPLSVLLNRQANPYETGQAFRYRLHSQMDLSKRGVFVEVVENRRGLESLHLLNPKHTWPVPDPDKFVAGFEMRLPSGETFPMPVYKEGKGGVLWIRRPHPTDPYSSSTWLDAAGISIDLDHYARVYNRNFLYNDGRPGGILVINEGSDISPEDASILQARMSGGPGSAGRVTIMEADQAAYHDTSTTARDAQYVESRALSKGEILGAAGTPESLWNASGRTFANADAELEGWWRNEMVPECEAVASFWEQLTAGGITNEDEVVTYAWEDISVLSRDEKQLEDRLAVEFLNGTITLDEYRVGTGKLPMDLPGSRVVWLTAGKAPVGAPEDVAAIMGQGQPPADGQTPPPDSEPPPAIEGGGDTPELPPGSDPAAPLAIESGGGSDDPLGDLLLGATETKALTQGKDTHAQQREVQAALIGKWETALADEIATLIRRQENVVMARLTGAKARKHTRHWVPKDGAAVAAHELKKLDAEYVIDRRRWIDEVVKAIGDMVRAAFGAAGTFMLANLDPEQEFDGGDTADEIVAKTVRTIAEGFDARAGRLQQVVTDGDKAGKSVEQIADDVKKAFTSADTWAAVSSRQVVSAMNAAQSIAAVQAGAVKKRWLCVAPETSVAASGVLEASRRRYEGPLVRVSTASGRGISVTPNHHVLTGRGWVAAQDVKDGDHLFHVVGVDPTGAPHVEGGPTGVGEFVDALMDAAPSKVRTMPIGVDLDGDVVDGQVQVSAADRQLRDNLMPSGSESVRDLALIATDETLGALPFSGPFGGEGGSDRLAEQLGGHPFAPGLTHAVGFAGDPVEPGGAHVSQRDVSGFEDLPDGGLGASESGSDSAGAVASQVCRDDVVNVEIVAFSGHVYDLSTEGGWYAADGLIVHNSTDDERTRVTHREAEGQIVDIGDPFQVGEGELMFPGDPTGPIGEWIACRCAQLFQTAERDFDAELDADLADLDAFEGESKALVGRARQAIGAFGVFDVRFDPSAHPRDHRGRFVDTPDVMFADGSRGVAVGSNDDGTVIVAKPTGAVVTVAPERLADPPNPVVTPNVVPEYGGAHRPPSRGDDVGASMDNIEEVMPDFYSRPNLYNHGYDPEWNRESVAAIMAARGNPDALLTVYRSVPPGVDTINPGDWVSTSRGYAASHGLHATDPEKDWPVISREVRAGDLLTHGDAMHEFGWAPDDSIVSPHAPDGGLRGLLSIIATGVAEAAATFDREDTEEPGQYQVIAAVPAAVPESHMEWPATRQARNGVPTVRDLIREEGIHPKAARAEWVRRYRAAKQDLVTAHARAEDEVRKAQAADIMQGASAAELSDVIGTDDTPDGPPKALYGIDFDTTVNLRREGFQAGPGAVRDFEDSPFETWAVVAARLGEGDVVPARNLTVHGVPVTRGWVTKRGGMPMLAADGAKMDTPEDAAPIFDAMEKAWREATVDMPPEHQAKTNGLSWSGNTNPSKIPGQNIEASGGDGTIAMWQFPPRPGVYVHESGHNIDTHPIRRGGRRHSQSKKWGTAVIADKSHVNYNLATLFNDGRIVEIDKAFMDSPLSPAGGASPTKYGASNHHEDFAESVRLYFKDRRHGTLGYFTTNTGEDYDLRFADLYPGRAAFLNELFGLPPAGVGERPISERTTSG